MTQIRVQHPPDSAKMSVVLPRHEDETTRYKQLSSRRPPPHFAKEGFILKARHDCKIPSWAGTVAVDVWEWSRLYSTIILCQSDVYMWTFVSDHRRKHVNKESLSGFSLKVYVTWK